MSEIILTATQRETLLSLQNTSVLYNTTQAALTTGKKVNSAADNAVAYFQSQSLYYRASDLTSIKTNIDQNIQALNTAQTATSSVESLLQNLQSVVEGARTDSLSQRVSATQQFTNLATQLAQLVEDSSYQGLNILTSTNASLITQFSERTAATYTVQGFNLIDPRAAMGALSLPRRPPFSTPRAISRSAPCSAMPAASAVPPGRRSPVSRNSI